VLPGFEGFEPGFDIPGFEPGFDVPGLDPFGVAPGLVDEPGVVGVVFGVVPGVVLFGFVVEGCADVPGFVGFEPGAALPVGGAVALPVGGAVVLPVGGADGEA